VNSKQCAWEVKRAAELSKRVIPIVGTPVANADVPELLRRLQYVDFHGESFARPLRDLATALRRDVEWIREHTRLTEAAARWQLSTREGGGTADDLLLRGEVLAGARAWAARR
jgi:hypothetical protein